MLDVQPAALGPCALTAGATRRMRSAIPTGSVLKLGGWEKKNRVSADGDKTAGRAFAA